MIEILDNNVESICPVCLHKIYGIKFCENNNVFIEKKCDIHGSFKVSISSNVNHYKKMESVFNVNRKKPKSSIEPKEFKGCPFDCGLCSNHSQDTCLAIIEVTNKCNLSCKNCFSNANLNNTKDPNLEEIKKMYETVLKFQNSPTCVQISGGEPTIRDDLPEIIKLGKDMGIDHIELNTNGIRISNDISFLEKIVNSGVDSIYLSFDGTNDSIYQNRCERNLFEIKKKAIENAKKYNIGIVLVPLISKNYNLESIGKIIEFGKENIPIVKGIHFQPMFTSGRSKFNEENYVSLYELIKEIEIQTNHEIKVSNFTPSLMPSPHCGLTCLSFLNNGKLVPLTNIEDNIKSNIKNMKDVATRTKNSVIHRWNSQKNNTNSNTFEIPIINSCCNSNISVDKNTFENNISKIDNWIDFVNLNENRYLTISIMGFQDSLTYETDRAKNCCIHVVLSNGKMIPFCNYNLSSIDGTYLYRFK